jgi:hypothetical protein
VFEPGDVAFYHLSRCEAKQQPHPDEHDEHVVELTYDRYEVGDQVDRHGQIEDKAWRDQSDSARYSPIARQCDGQSKLVPESEPQDALDEFSVCCIDRSPEQEAGRAEERDQDNDPNDYADPDATHRRSIYSVAVLAPAAPITMAQ